VLEQSVSPFPSPRMYNIIDGLIFVPPKRRTFIIWLWTSVPAVRLVHTHTHTHTYIYITLVCTYIHAGTYVCTYDVYLNAQVPRVQLLLLLYHYCHHTYILLYIYIIVFSFSLIIYYRLNRCDWWRTGPNKQSYWYYLLFYNIIMRASGVGGLYNGWVIFYRTKSKNTLLVTKICSSRTTLKNSIWFHCPSLPIYIYIYIYIIHVLVIYFLMKLIYSSTDI